MKLSKFLIPLFTILIVAVTTFFITDSVLASSFIGGVVYAINPSMSIVHNQAAFNQYMLGNADGAVPVLSTERSRVTYENLKQQFGGKLTPSYLRLEATLKQGQSIIQFNTFVGDGASVYATEKRLDRNDKFYVDSLSVFLLKQDIANGKTNGRLHTYPNFIDFTAAQAADLMALYNGELNITIGDEKRLNGFDVRRFLKIPETQQTSATNYDELSGNNDLIALTPHFIIDGSGTNIIELKYPTYASWAGHSAVAGTEHRVVLYMRGFLSVGASANK